MGSSACQNLLLFFDAPDEFLIWRTDVFDLLSIGSRFSSPLAETRHLIAEDSLLLAENLCPFFRVA